MSAPSLALWPDPASCAIVSKPYRGYKTPDGHFVSVTTALKALGLSTNALVAWSAREERTNIVAAMGDVYAEWSEKPPEHDGPREFTAAVVNRIGQAKAHQKKLAEAGEIGTAVHEMIRWTLVNEMGGCAGPEPKLPDAALWAFMAWQDWWKAQGQRPVAVEQPIWDPEVGYAGTIDLISEGPNGFEIHDWKTGKGIYDDYHLQVAAYKRAAERIAPISRVRITRIPKVIGDPAPETVEMGEMYGGRKLSEEELFTCFACALTLWHSLMKPVGA